MNATAPTTHPVNGRPLSKNEWGQTVTHYCSARAGSVYCDCHGHPACPVVLAQADAEPLPAEVLSAMGDSLMHPAFTERVGRVAAVSLALGEDPARVAELALEALRRGDRWGGGPVGFGSGRASQQPDMTRHGALGPLALGGGQ